MACPNTNGPAKTQILASDQKVLYFIPKILASDTPK